MTTPDKYANPFADFGFDKLFVTDPNTGKLTEDKTYQRLFETADIENFSPTEKAQYDESLKIYRDLKNVIAYAMEQGYASGIKKAKIAAQKKITDERIKKYLLLGKLTIQEIAEDFEVTTDYVLKINEEWKMNN